MELEGKKVTQDFLSLYSSDPSFQLPDPRSTSRGRKNERMTEGFILNTRDFLRPLETEEGYGNDASEVPATVKAVIQAEGVLPGGVGSYAVSHVPDAAASVKASGSARGFPILSEAKSEPDYCSRSTTTSYGSLAGGASYTLWDEKDTVSRDLSIKVEPKASCNDQRPNTPRSKHSATEQRRRCKINDRQASLPLS